MKSNGIDFESIARELLPKSLELLRQWFPAGVLQGREFRVGSLSGEAGESLSINTETGLWGDFATGQTGKDLIDLYAAIKGIKNSEAAKHLSNGQVSTQQDIFLIGEKCRSIPSHKHGIPVGIYEYKNLEGITYGYVCRFQPLNQDKEFAPLTYWQTPDGKKIWKWKKWPHDSQPYHAELIKAKPEARILIVEGEKKADRAQRLFPDGIVLGWCGGAGTVSKTDWQALKFRYCWIWPDKDEPGSKAAKALKKILPDLHIVAIPEELPQGWDLGDAPDDFDIEAHLRIKPKANPVTENETPHETTTQRTSLLLPAIKGGKPLSTIENLNALLEFHGITVRYNVISKRYDINIPGEEFSPDNADNAKLARIISRAMELGMPSTQIKSYVEFIGDKNQYNPALNWVLSKPWDGYDYLADLCATIKAKNEHAKNLFIRRWLITAVQMLLHNGLDSACCLVLQGGQGIGKTWWFRKICPIPRLIRTGANLDSKNKDSVAQLIRYWIVELGEIGSTFSRSDIDSLKAFITSDMDILRRPYSIVEQTYPRRTALAASVNDFCFLHDTTGNRRFLTIECISVNSYHEIDMQQVFAQIYDEICQGETHLLTEEEKQLVDEINLKHLPPDPIEEMIIDRYNWDNPIVHTKKSATHTASELGIKIPTKKDTNAIAATLRKFGCEEGRTGKGIWFLVPEAK